MTSLTRAGLAILLMALAANVLPAQFPDMIYYKFDEGTGVGGMTANVASPLVGSLLAPVTGHSLDAGIGQFAGGLQAAPMTAAANGVATGWPTAFGTSSWTISLWLDVTAQVSPTSLCYVFGDSSAGGFRCFTNGVAGPGNIMIRGPLTDTILPGGGAGGPHVITWVYDATVPEIRGYLDGVLGVTGPQSALNINGSGLKAGGYTASTFQPGARMDEFRVYSYALTAAEIAATWSTPVQGTNVLTVAQTGPGVGDLFITLTQISPTATAGWTLISADTSGFTGTGSFFGIEPDALTWALLFTSVLADGNIFQFPVPSPTGAWPNTGYFLPPGSVSSLAGLTLDFGVVLVGPGLVYDGKSNVDRFYFQ